MCNNTFLQFFCLHAVPMAVVPCHFYASPSFGDAYYAAYSDWQLTLNFELSVETFCVSTCFHIAIYIIIYIYIYDGSEILSVCPYLEKRNRLCFINVSPTLVANWYINGKVFTSTTAWKTKRMIFLNAYLSVFAVVFCKQFLAYTVHTDWSAFSCNP